MPIYKIPPEKQREYYLKWRETHMEKSLANSKRTSQNYRDWNKIAKIFRNILLEPEAGNQGFLALLPLKGGVVGEPYGSLPI